ncbi:metal-dependent transcriptional regulator [Corynebacterium uterequi]|uniref:Diphtheria toxin repressor n=1 Tax=Corynebacterium uterequi TaxID=1072256 RepID=A0A0G3HD91_9CORY|nr:metal-dependent transcriptional regulator [Corynebacterium uterequi]AKK11274.1 iron (metal) dependent repressor, DtxR family [Corynebacterium uterequi]
MKDLVDTTEMYLRTIYELEEEGIVPLRARIAERLEQSGPTVSQTVARMERDGLLLVSPDRSLKMTALGRDLAVKVMRKHRLAERLLTDVLNLDISQVHDEACRWEHVMSEDVERRVVDIVSDPVTSPFGNPIPGLAQLGVSVDPLENTSQRLSDLDITEPTAVRVAQLNEILQVDSEVFRDFAVADIHPGSEVTVELVADGAELTTGAGHVVFVPGDLTHAVRVDLLK